MLLVAAGGVGAWWWSRPAARPRRPGERVADALAAGMLGAMATASAMREPFACARWPALDEDASEAPEVVTAFGRRFERTGPELRVDGGDGALVIGFVADARGAEPVTLANAAAARAAFERDGVELVVALGGLGRDEDEIAAVLDALARDARWPVVAVPGGRESWPAHRAAVERVAASGRAVAFDGARVRAIAMDGVAVGTLPGIAEPAQLFAGNDGCVHDVESLVSFARAFAGRPGPRVLASYAPPRQQGDGGSDMAAGGVHIGEIAVAEALAAADADALVHGLMDEAAEGPARGRHAPGKGPLLLGAGALDGLPSWTADDRAVGGSAVVLRATARGISWQRVGLPVAVD